MKIFSIEGNWQHLDGGSMFGNAPKSMWGKWIESDSQNLIPLACRALLVQTDGKKNILFEVGIGAFFEPSLKERYGVEPEEHILLKNLSNIGIQEGDIDAVVLSHLHFDHAGGLLPAYGDTSRELVFPKALYYVGKKHWEYAQNPHPREKASFIPHLHDLLKKSGRMILFDQPQHKDLDFGLNFHYSDGHTIGMVISQVNLSSGPIIFVNDLIPGNPWVHLPLTMGYDRFPELKVDEKKRLYESVLDSHAKLFFTHDPIIPCVELKKDEKGKYSGEPIKLESIKM
jgi:glyoxylase-like metal-dependent hydrolase (beta-lactamase superfamily II)